MTQFNELGLNKALLKALDALGFEKASEIQAQAIPFVLNNKNDLIALAQTGTGKTAAFSLPILEKIKNKKGLQTLIICPTRELSLQISEDIISFCKFQKDIEVVSVYGGERIDLQIRKLKRGANIVVGTPGRLHDLVRRNVLNLEKIKYVVLDEADEMLDMGFKDDLDAIIQTTPKSRQTLLFSATFSGSVRQVAKSYMQEAHEIKVGEENSGAKNVSHEYYMVSARDRLAALERILDSQDGISGIIFCRTKVETQALSDKLKQLGYNAEALHGDISQNIRTKIMANFKKKNISLLVATDVAARGIDVSNLSHVINYNLPDNLEAYNHRSGRTGRAGSSGVSISICGARDKSKINRLEKYIGRNFTYKKIPKGSEIVETKVANYITKIQTDTQDITKEACYDRAVDQLKNVKKEDIIKFIFKEKFSRLLNNQHHDKDINADLKTTSIKQSSSSRAIRLSIGKNQKAEVKDIFSLINSNKKTKGMDIGRIVIKQNYSLISVSKKDAEQIMSNSKIFSWKNKNIDISFSDEVLARANRPRRSKSYRRRR